MLPIWIVKPAPAPAPAATPAAVNDDRIEIVKMSEGVKQLRKTLKTCKIPPPC